MKPLTICLTVLIMVLSMSFTDDKPAYVLFDKEGKEVKYTKMLKDLAGADIVLFGEVHNNTLCHWLQLQVLKDLYRAKHHKVKLAMEMFETDDQVVISEYFDDLIKENHFQQEAKLWTNYVTDYRAMVNFAKEHKLPLIASNIPRRYASLVAREGLKALDKLDKKIREDYLPPLPVEVDYKLPGYVKMTEMIGSGHGNSPENFVASQAVKDATMANSIYKAYKKDKDHLVFHLNGSFHSENFEGIVWYLKKLNPELKIMTISTVEQEFLTDLNKESKGIADFVLVLPSDMTKSH